MRKIAPFVSLLFILCLAFGQADAKTKDDAGDRRDSGFYKPAVTSQPNILNVVHKYNNLQLCVSNWGFFGSEDGERRDCETNASAPSGEFPAGSLVEYLFQGALWIGAVVGEDTLVSVGADGWQLQNELYPCAEPTPCQMEGPCGIERRSNRPQDPYYHPDAKSDLEYIAVYTDTLSNPQWTGDDWEGRAHIPINIAVRQSSYSWSVDYAQDFVLIDYSIKNIGSKTIENLYLGIYSDGDVGHKSLPSNDKAQDDVCGFLQTAVIHPCECPDFEDTIDLTYIMDNDGDPTDGAYDYKSSTSVLGTRVMRSPSQDVKKVSFNWWQGNGQATFDWGPMLEATKRNFGTGGQGTPEGDRNKYYMLSNGEHDYNQIFAAQDFSDEGWLPPSPVAARIANGGDTRFLLSFGPFNIRVGDSLGITCAYVAGELLHKNPAANETYMQQAQPDPTGFYANLDFRDVSENAVWAAWVYDNPGYDTDGDGYSGDSCVDINGEVCWYRGDGVADYRAATAPPPPVLRYTTEYEKVKLKWNGYVSETAIDPFTHVEDFEGYRIYWGKIPTVDKMARLESRDFDDFRRYRWDPNRVPSAFVSVEPPSKRTAFEDEYGDGFDPEDYLCENMPDSTGWEWDGEIYCFEPADWNQSISGWDDGASLPSMTGIQKTYAAEIYEGIVKPILDSSVAAYWVKDIDPLTGDSVMYHKYWEYEYSIDNLLASVPHYFSVTAFDFGEFRKKYGETKGLAAQESSPLANVVELWAINDAATVQSKQLDVQVYPNPYIGDGRYWDSEYEDPFRTGFVDHERKIHFVNLPPEATLRIYTLDGDLVKVIDHPGATSDWDSKVYWNMRSRNNELVASGIYLFSVESDYGNQVGKFVVIF